MKSARLLRVLAHISLLLPAGVVIAAALSAGAQGAPSAGSSTKHADNAELTLLFNEDQRVRDAKPLGPNEPKITRTDADRLMLVKHMIAHDQLNTAADYRHAGFIVQHSPSSPDYLLAHTLAVVCASEGNKNCKWLTAATLDRYLQSIKQPQIYGTQYLMSTASPTTQQPYDSILITDSLRKQLGVPPVAEQAAQANQAEDEFRDMLAVAAQNTPAVATQTAPIVVGYGPPKDPAVLHTTFVDFDSLPHTNSRPVFDNPTLGMDKVEVHITTLAPGKESHPVHRHPWEEIIYVRDGQVDFTINGIVHHAGPGAYAFFASNDPHNAHNVGTTPATYYVVNFVPDTASTPAAANAPSATTQNLPGKFGSTVIDTNSLPVIATTTGSRSVVVQSQPTVTFLALESHITRLDPGKQTTPDTDPNDEVCIVREGQVEVTVNGISSRMNAGSLMYWAPTDKRNLRNVGSTPASYLVIRATSDKSPKPPAVAH